MLILLLAAVLAAEPAGLSTSWISVPQAQNEAGGVPFRFGVDHKGRVWFGYWNGLLFEAATPAAYRMSRSFEDFLWLGSGDFVVAAGSEVGNAAPGARQAGQKEQSLEFKTAVRLSGSIRGLHPSGEGSLYIHVVEGAGSSAFWMDIGKKGQGRLEKVFDADDPIAALAGDGRESFAASGRRVMKVAGSGSLEAIFTHPREDISGLAYSPAAGLFYATPTRVGVVRDSKPYEIKGLEAGGRLRLQGKDLFVWPVGSARVLRVRGAAGWGKIPQAPLEPVISAESLEGRAAVSSLRSETSRSDQVREETAPRASWNDPAGASSAQPRPLPRKAIAGALAGLIAMATVWFFLRQQKKNGYRSSARSKIQARPQESAQDLMSYLHLGGRLEDFEAEEVCALFGLLEAEASWKAILRGATPGWRRLLSAKLSLAQAHEQACSLLEDSVLADAASTERGLDGVLDVFEGAGRLDEFLTIRSRGFPPAFQQALDAALTRRGRKAAPADTSNWSPQEYADGFRRKVGEADFAGAQALFGRAELILTVKDHPGLYYDFARLAERGGDLGRATEIYKKFIVADIVFKDVLERFARLKEGPAYSGPVEKAAAPIGRESDLSGRYEMKSQLGMGGMGVVFMGFDRKLSRPVAIKKMRTDVQWDAHDRERFLHEAQLIAKLNHPYIVGIHEIIDNGGEIHLVFDYVDGKPLSTVIRERGKLTMAEIKMVLDPVCQAIDYAHRNRVLHRDLKPSNIMIDVNGFAKVMDFGLAREIKETVSRLSGTESGGTLAYMAPEQHLGRSGKSGDVFALGVCLYEMATGQLPYSGPDYLAQKERRAYTPPQFLNPALPKEIEGVVAKILAPKPEERAAEAMDIMALLKTIP